MLHLIPAPLHRQLYRVAHAVRRQWWRVRRLRGGGVIVVAFDERGRVLLVRHSYGRPVWSLPGGSVNRRESPEQAAAREIREELGCGLADLRAIDASREGEAAPFPELGVFAARLAGDPVADMREIVAVAWFDPEDLPDDCGWRTRQLIERLAAATSQQR